MQGDQRAAMKGVKDACSKCGSEHCSGQCYELTGNPYAFTGAAAVPASAKCDARECGPGDAFVECNMPAHFHEDSDGPVPVHEKWCLIHAPDKFGVSKAQKVRVLKMESAMALTFLRKAVQVFIEKHPGEFDLRTCPYAVDLQRTFQAFEDLERQIRERESS